MPSIAQPLFSWDKPRCTVFEDMSDRLNHVWTFGILLVLAGLVCIRQAVYPTISCWLPNNYKEGNRQYVQDLCWNSHVITFPKNDEISSENINNKEKYLPIVYSKSSFVSSETKRNEGSTLYQWIPVLLTFQALLFKCPHLFLTTLHGYSGLSFNKLVDLTVGYDRLNIAERRVLGNQIARYLYNWCDNFGQCIPWRFLTLVYVLTKFIYCINVIVQVCLLDSFLRNPGSSNLTSFSDVIDDKIFSQGIPKWTTSQAFPRQVLCEYRSPNSEEDMSKARCFLSMNVFNEQVFAIIWVWFLFVSTVTCTSLVSCLVKISIGFFRKRFIKKNLGLAENKEDALLDTSDIAKFADWIGEDCIMALKVIGANSSEILVSDIVCSMLKKRKRYKTSNKAGYIDMTSGNHTSPPRIKIHPVVTDMEN